MVGVLLLLVPLLLILVLFALTFLPWVELVLVLETVAVILHVVIFGLVIRIIVKIVRAMLVFIKVVIRGCHLLLTEASVGHAARRLSM